MQIFVKTLNGSILSIGTDPQELIVTVKQQIEQKAHIPSNGQHLTFLGKQLEDSHTISSYNIQQYDTLSLVARLLGGFQLFIKTLTGQTITIEIEGHNSVLELKERVQEKTGVPVSEQRIINAGKQLQDERTLADYNIDGRHTLHLVLRGPGGMQLFIKTLTGRTITVDCERDDTVFDVKLRIEDKEGIPVDQILLIFLGEKMEDDRPIGSYRIQLDVTLHLVLKLRELGG